MRAPLQALFEISPNMCVGLQQLCVAIEDLWRIINFNATTRRCQKPVPQMFALFTFTLYCLQEFFIKPTNLKAGIP